MKDIVKRIGKLCLLTMLLLGLLGCGSSTRWKKGEADPQETAMKKSVESFCDQLFAASDKELLQYKGAGEFYQKAVETWQANRKVTGDFQKAESLDYSLEDGLISVTMEGKFEKKDAIVTITFLKEEKTPTQFLMEAKASLAESMTQAGMNTLIGVATVFAVLIFLAFIISLFRHIPTPETKEKKLEEEKLAMLRARKRERELEEAREQEKLEDDKELVALIAGAIAAYEGIDPEGFTVRSIKKVRKNHWKRG